MGVTFDLMDDKWHVKHMEVMNLGVTKGVT